ncbi:MAG: tetratricopeptide repeat protein, partial [Bacteroidota bacterium]
FSNLVFGIGAFMNERFMYIPSLGFGAIFAYFLTNTVPCRLKNAARYERTFLPLIFATVLVLYSAKTITRNAAWENDEVLALTDAKVSVNSAKVNMSAGSALLTLGQQTSDPIQKRKYFEQGIGHLEHSVSIYPSYVQSLHLLGTTHLELQDYDRALYYYDIVMRVNPDFGDTKRNLEVMGNLCIQRKEFQAAINAYNKLLQYHPGMVRIWAALGEVYGKHLQDYPKSLEYLRKAEQLDPNDSDVLQKIGVVYAMTGQSQPALDVFLRALEVSPNNPSIMMNVGVVYRNLGQEELGLQYLNEAFRLKPELRQSFQQ